MMKRIENIIPIIEGLDEQETLIIADDLGFNPDILRPLNISQIKYLIIDRYNRSSKDAIKVEDSVHLICDRTKILYTQEFIHDMEIRMESWYIPIRTILEYYGFEYFIDYMNEAIYLHQEDYSHLSQKIGVEEDTIIRYGINSFLFTGFESNIIRQYHVISRKDKIQNLRNKISEEIDYRELLGL